NNVSRTIKESGLEVSHRTIRTAGFVRNEFTAFPLIGLIDKAIDSEVSYFSRIEISEFIENNPLNLKSYFLDYSPVRVKYWQICHIEWLNQLQKINWDSGDNINRTVLPDELNFDKVQKPAFEKYFEINYNSNKTPHTIRKKYFFKVGEEKSETYHQNKIKKEELYVLAATKKNKIRFGLVNEHVDNKHFLEAAKGTSILHGRLETCYQILDEVQRKKCDIAVQPELSVPFDYVCVIGK